MGYCWQLAVAALLQFRTSITHVVHYHGFEANGTFTHVGGSAWDPHDWEMRPNVANGSIECEHQCEGRDACNAFVFSPSTHLCFLIQFSSSRSIDEVYRSCRRPAKDRVFGLVRMDKFDRRAWTNTKDHTDRSLPNGQITLANQLGIRAEVVARDDFRILPSISRQMSAPLALLAFQCLVCLLIAFIVLAAIARSRCCLEQVLAHIKSKGILISACFFLHYCIPIDIASLLAFLVIAMFASALWLLWQAASASPRPRLSVSEGEHSADLEEVCEQQYDKGLPVRASGTPRGDIGWAGPTNYPVAGAVSPTAKGVVTEPLMLCTNIDAEGLGSHEAQSLHGLVLKAALGTMAVAREVTVFAALFVLFLLVRHMAVYAFLAAVVVGGLAFVRLKQAQEMDTAVVGGLAFAQFKTAQEIQSLPTTPREDSVVGFAKLPQLDSDSPLSPDALSNETPRQSTLTLERGASSCAFGELLTPPKVPKEIAAASMRCKMAYDIDGNIIDRPKVDFASACAVSHVPTPVRGRHCTDSNS